MNAQQFAGVNQYAYIWNYNAHVEHQHNYYGGAGVDISEISVSCR